MVTKSAIKNALGELPLTAEAYWWFFRQKEPLSKSFTLNRVEPYLKGWQKTAGTSANPLSGQPENRQKILIFATLRYWIEHAVLTGIALAGMGHDVTLAYLPYGNWFSSLNKFDLRQQQAYAQKVLEQAEPLIKIVPLFDWLPVRNDEQQLRTLPQSLQHSLEQVSIRDTQYTHQVENVNLQQDTESGRLYNLRLSKNQEVAYAFLRYLDSIDEIHRPDIFITPNGSILEMGATYQVARYLDIPTVTYEFGEQTDRIWLAKNSEVMLQNTDQLWENYDRGELSPTSLSTINDLYRSRQNASLWGNFSRQWQDTPSQSEDEVRGYLSLDARPVILLAANVIGDSLTLNRQVFTENMTQWLIESTRYLNENPDIQTVIRIHPGERFTKGPSVSEIIKQAIPDLNEHIHIVNPADTLNTYSIFEVTSLGLVYTTTVGMEMAMAGIPVIVSGQTHYRERGFTYDPQTWSEYIDLINGFSTDPGSLTISENQVKDAWKYAYLFFFEYPLPFPWHMRYFQDQIDEWTMERVLSDEGLAKFGSSFKTLAGIDRVWNSSAQKTTRHQILEKQK